ncbi:transaldolase family protein [Streptomyces sp. NPDC015127]|uniref:transaldolase family protein n=1 Tax=Streptomyces sp. NPDC015127 TaxID=3364939 RepID=UPI0036FD30B3
MNDTIRRLARAGTSVWLDDLGRDALDSGELEHLVERGLIRGVTTNPTIFRQAIRGSACYTDQLAALGRLSVPATAALRHLTCADVRRAADVLRPLHGPEGDGTVSLEVSPHLGGVRRILAGATTLPQGFAWGYPQATAPLPRSPSGTGGAPSVAEMPGQLRYQGTPAPCDASPRPCGPGETPCTRRRVLSGPDPPDTPSPMTPAARWTRPGCCTGRWTGRTS